MMHIKFMNPPKLCIYLQLLRYSWAINYLSVTLNPRYVEKQLIYLRGSYLVMKGFVLPLYCQCLSCLYTDHQRLTSHTIWHCILSNHNLKKHKISSNHSVKLHPTDQKMICRPELLLSYILSENKIPSICTTRLKN